MEEQEKPFGRPPPVLDCARVIAYAHNDESAPYLGRSRIYSGSTRVERVPALAICENLGEDADILLFHCDENWNVLGCSGSDTVQATIANAERDYPGLSERLVWLNTSEEAALAFYDATFGGRCSFCGKRAFEVTGLVQGGTACICRPCVERFYEAFASPEAQA